MTELINTHITRVSEGLGGDAYLIAGREGTALIDSGMAFNAENLIQQIKQVIGEANLDFILLSHTHYDHSGGIALLRREWPKLIVLGEAHGKRTLQKQSAIKAIVDLSALGAEHFGKTMPAFDEKDLRIDECIKDGDVIDLGNIQIEVIGVPGHTKCSLAFFLRNESILFASETTGIIADYGEMTTGFLTSYKDSMESVKKCRKLQAKFIICPHYGPIPEADAKNYWDWAVKSMETSKNFVVKFNKDGYDEAEILKKYVKKFRSERQEAQQPYEAFEMNAIRAIEVIVKEFCQEKIY